jgi:hypothetical protein
VQPKCDFRIKPAVREAIGLEQVPRFTTLQAFADTPEIMALIDSPLHLADPHSGHNALAHNPVREYPQ